MVYKNIGNREMNAKEFYEAGQLNNAIDAVTQVVKKHPKDTNSRAFLCELLLIMREWDRADKQLDFIGHQNPDAMPGVALWRQLIRAGQARDQFFSDGRAPEVLETPNDLVQTYLKASVALRESNLSEAKQFLDAAEELRPQLKGTINDVEFDDFRDLDDIAPGVMELFTSTGKYYWIPLSRIIALTFHKPESPLDLVLRRATIETNHDGPEGEVYIPAVYHRVSEEDKERVLLGKSTDWVGEENDPVFGLGQKMFYANDQAMPIMEIEEITFAQ